MSGFSSWFSSTLVGELLIYLKTKYFSVHLGEYRHFPSDEAFAHSVEWLLTGLFIGLILASLASVIRNRRILRLLGAVKAAGADSPATAKSLAELGFAKNRRLARTLAQPTPLSRLFSRVEDADTNTTRFYLTPEHLESAELRYRKRGSSWGFFALTVLLAVLTLALLMRLFPLLLGFIDGMRG